MRVRDEYESLGELGAGGYGRVFAAQHRQSGQRVAIKSLHEKMVNPVDQARFRREAMIRLDSPHVVQVFDVRIEDGQVYMIMEHVPGVTIDKRLEFGQLPLGESLRIGEGVAAALEVVHEHGFVHRDIKPANIFLTPEMLVKLGDFGIAKDHNAIEVLTRSGQGMGTLAYVAPEQAMDAKRVEHYADLYSLGATLYHLIAGCPPFSITSAGEAVVAIVQDPPPPLQGHRPDCPDDVAALIHRLLEKDPTDRAPSARSVRKRLGKMARRY